MNKAELIAVVAKDAGLSKTAAALAIDALFNAITTSLSEGESVKLPGFGNFEIRERDERSGFNPRKKEKIIIPASKAPVFKASNALKEKCR